MPERTASQLKLMTPTGFPSASPRNTAVAMGSLRSASDIGTPALANANSGMMTNPTQGCSMISSRSTGQSVSPLQWAAG